MVRGGLDSGMPVVPPHPHTWNNCCCSKRTTRNASSLSLAGRALGEHARPPGRTRQRNTRGGSCQTPPTAYLVGTVAAAQAERGGSCGPLACTHAQPEVPTVHFAARGLWCPLSVVQPSNAPPGCVRPLHCSSSGTTHSPHDMAMHAVTCGHHD